VSLGPVGRVWRQIEDRIREAVKWKAEVFKAEVAEVAPDSMTGYVRVTHEADYPGFERAPSLVIGAMPIVGDTVRCFGTAFYSVVITGGTSSGGTDDQTAAEVPYSGSTTLSATNVEAALDELDTEKVPSTLSVSTTAPLSGGGDLSANRTLSVTAATEAATGVVELATSAETTTGTDTTRATTPAGVKAVADTKVPTTRTVSTTAPLSGGGDLSANRTLSVTAATEAASGVVELATNAETVTGTDTTRAVHPAGVAAAIAGVSGAAPIHSFHATQTTGQNNLPVSTDTILTGFTEVHDSDGNFAANAYTCPVSGLYHFGGGCKLTTVTDTRRMELRLYVNGTTVPTHRAETIAYSWITGSAEASVYGTITRRFTAGDVVRLAVFNSFTAATSDTDPDPNYTYFYGHLVRAT
jgi:hypothetical protein